VTDVVYDARAAANTADRNHKGAAAYAAYAAGCAANTAVRQYPQQHAAAAAHNSAAKLPGRRWQLALILELST